MNEIEILKEINKGSKYGINGINLTLQKAVDSNFKKVLVEQKSEYENIYNRSKTLLALKDQKSEDLDPLEKAMSWMAIQMSTLTNASNSKLAEILIQGNDLGIIKGQKLLNSPHVKDSTTKNIIKDFITLQQENIEGLKKYL